MAWRSLVILGGWGGGRILIIAVFVFEFSHEFCHAPQMWNPITSLLRIFRTPRLSAVEILAKEVQNSLILSREELEKKMVRLFRRHGLVVEQLSAKMDLLEKNLERKLSDRNELSESPVFLHTLQQLYQIASSRDLSEGHSAVLRELTTKLEKELGLCPLVHLGADIHSNSIEVVGVVEGTLYPKGVVCDIVQQGFVKEDGTVLCHPKVIVSGGTGKLSVGENHG